jgi:hypothetical protein
MQELALLQKILETQQIQVTSNRNKFRFKWVKILAL